MQGQVTWRFGFTATSAQRPVVRSRTVIAAVQTSFQAAAKCKLRDGYLLRASTPVGHERAYREKFRQQQRRAAN